MRLIKGESIDNRQYAIGNLPLVYCLLLIAYYPCLCLKRGFFLLITYSLPLRRTILQSTLRFLMDALTFIVICFNPEL